MLALEVVGTRKNLRARGRNARGEGGAPSPLARLPLARLFFLAPATQAILRQFIPPAILPLVC